jgi:excisionase family DNA binding protein
MLSDEVAELLRVEQQTIQIWCHKRKFPFVQISRRDYRFKPEDVQAWINKHYVPAEKPGLIPNTV